MCILNIKRVLPEKFYETELSGHRALGPLGRITIVVVGRFVGVGGGGGMSDADVNNIPGRNKTKRSVTAEKIKTLRCAPASGR